MGTDPTATPMTKEQQVLLWANVSGTLASTIAVLAGAGQVAAAIPVVEKLIAAAIAGLEAAKGQPVTPESVEALRSTIVLVPPKE